MTAQMSDRFIYRQTDYELAGINGDGLFDPAQHGLNPIATCTSCWRGFHCKYEIRDSQLLLRTLRITHGVRERDSERIADAPALSGRRPVRATEEFPIFRSIYEDVDLLVPFTGGLLLARGFIEALYVHMGFHPAWKFREVHELLFDRGRLTQATDRSAEMAKLREDVEGRGECEDPGQLVAWIDRCFSLRYTW